MTNNLKSLSILIIMMSFLSCSKEKQVENAREKINGKWEVTSWKVDSIQVSRVLLDRTGTMHTQCGTTIPYIDLSILENDTFNFSSEGKLFHSNSSLIRKTNYDQSYSSCSVIDSVYLYHFNTSSYDAPNYPYDLLWEIDDADQTHFTIIEPTKSYDEHGNFYGWTNVTFEYEILKLNKNELIINRIKLLINGHPNILTFWGIAVGGNLVVNGTEEIKLKRIK